MTQRDRDGLVLLKKARKKLITQRQAATELNLTERQVTRLLGKLANAGDKAVVRGLRGRQSNRRLDEKTRTEVLRILSADAYRGFGPTLAAEYLASKYNIQIGRESLRQILPHPSAKLLLPPSPALRKAMQGVAKAGGMPIWKAAQISLNPRQRRAKAARRAFKSPRPPLRGFTQECRPRKTPRSRTSSEGLCRFFGASPVASALGIRAGATPRERIHPTIHLHFRLSKPDISTWQRIGHFYLVLTGFSLAGVDAPK